MTEQRLVELDHGPHSSPLWKWGTTKPQSVGWYWFRVGNDSPRGMTRLAVAIVHVSKRYAESPLMVLLPQGNYPVESMGGEWAGPVPLPE